MPRLAAWLAATDRVLVYALLYAAAALDDDGGYGIPRPDVGGNIPKGKPACGVRP